MPITQLLDNSMDLQKDLSEVTLSPDSVIKTKDFRAEYAKTIAAAPFLDKERADKIVATQDNEPIFELRDMHPEDLPERNRLIQLVTDISVDLTTADYQIIDLANNYTGLISSTINRMNVVKERILRNKERLEDINFITASYKGLSDAILITPEMCSGTYLEQNGVFGAFCPSGESEIKEEIQILAVEGNGYVGNNHVLTAGDKYLADTEDRGDMDNLSDNSPLTIFEYSRICSKDNNYYESMSDEDAEGNSISTTYDVNRDNKDVTCTITLMTKSGNGMNMLKLDTLNNKIKIKDVLTSDDNIRYYSVLSTEIDLRADMYHSADYVAGSNIISFPSALYVKLVLTSDYVEPGEILGYDVVDLSGKEPKTVIRRLNNAVRKVIQLAGINAYLCDYEDSTFLTTDIAPENGCKSVAVFANEYIPTEMENGEPIRYELYINGTKYNVKPINGERSGIKMISCTESQFENTNILFIDEKIETVQLRVTISCEDNMSPFVGNLKLCVG